MDTSIAFLVSVILLMHVQTNPYALTGDYGFPVTKVMRFKPQEDSMIAPSKVVSKDKGSCQVKIRGRKNRVGFL